MGAPKTLGLVERQILANQYRILAKIAEEDHESKHYHNLAEILTRGYTLEYTEVFNVYDQEVPFDVCNETIDILNMFRYIDNFIATLDESDLDRLNTDRLKFKGFDGNHDDHYNYTVFMHEELGKWNELKGKPLNSHSQMTLSRYRELLQIWRADPQYSINLDKLGRMSEVL